MYLYFMKAGDAIKTGIAENVDKRIVQVQVGNPFKIELLCSVKVSEEKALQVESKIHQLFVKTNLQGEWFQATRFMIEYIENIKENGLDSHLEWLERRYEKTYRNILKSLKAKIEADIIIGNLISLDELKVELSDLLNKVFLIPSIPLNLTESVRNWVEERKTVFTPKDVCYHFGISQPTTKKTIRVILGRLVKNGIINRLQTGVYEKVESES